MQNLVVEKYIFFCPDRMVYNFHQISKETLNPSLNLRTDVADNCFSRAVNFMELWTKQVVRKTKVVCDIFKKFGSERRKKCHGILKRQKRHVKLFLF